MHLSLYGISGFYTLLSFFALVLEIAGSVLIIYGGLRAIVKVLILEIRKGVYTYNIIRRDFPIRSCSASNSSLQPIS